MRSVPSFRLSTALVTLLLTVGCSQPDEQPARVEPGASPRSTPATSAPAAADTRPVIVAFGDSLSAGYGVGEAESFPAYLQAAFDERGLAYRVVNQGISGDTTSGGLTRIGEAIALQPHAVILELGGNDGLRGLPVSASKDNLDQMIRALKQNGIRVLLAGITLPPNYGPDYIASFERMYKDLAREHRVPLIDFLLDGVATRKELMQRDGIHPTAEGNRMVAETVLEALLPLLEAPVRR